MNKANQTSARLLANISANIEQINTLTPQAHTIAQAMGSVNHLTQTLTELNGFIKAQKDNITAQQRAILSLANQALNYCAQMMAETYGQEIHAHYFAEYRQFSAQRAAFSAHLQNIKERLEGVQVYKTVATQMTTREWQAINAQWEKLCKAV
ncbi:hypothetical protein HPC38_02240 [Pasteurellaceae bacterium HPA106]|uniref:hypothetical protein n=1 Tax=Spirabiliibacterium pneumoniae TaxID=221400 RepID=UPI001AAD261F|nr:hypothetical protein [Spirabiliibacterium pneumoniae]MBE2895698.1 hypothetical protein [Spirabiliibacterium pneumoniae]